MCHKSKFCTELNKDAEKWNKLCPLPLPNYFNEAVDGFTRAISEIVKGGFKESLKALEECNSEAVGRFFIEHGQQSSYSRVFDWKKVKIENKLKKRSNPSPRNPTGRLTREVYERDYYRCRYCGSKIITKEVFREYSRIIGSNNFSVARKNSERNGLTLGLRGVVDHVHPHSLGGRTELDNLVTSCYSCNFGKAEYTLEQVKIESPYSRQPKDDGWRGLTEFLPALKVINKPRHT